MDFFNPLTCISQFLALRFYAPMQNVGLALKKSNFLHNLVILAA